MIKKRIKYEDFNGEVQVEDFYFHLSKTELLDNIGLRARLTAVQTAIGDGERDLTEAEVQAILDIIRDLIKLSYGQRSDDGKRFRKSDDIWQAFAESPAHDELIFGLFETPEAAVEFMTGIIPKDLLEKAEQEKPSRPKPQDRLPKKESTSTQETVESPEEDTAAEIERLKAQLAARDN